MALVNGIEYSWASLRFAFLGNVDVKGVQAITYKQMRAKENLYGVGDEPVARGYGNKTYEGEIRLMQKEVRALRAAAGNKSLTEIAPFTLIVQFANGTDPIQSDQLLNVEFLEDGLEGEQGNPEMPVTIPIILSGILFNA